MTPIEGSEEHPAGQEAEGSHKRRSWPIEIGIRPFENEAAEFRRTPGGGYTILLRGEILLTIHPPTPEAAESPVRADSEPSGTQIPEPPPEAHTGQSKAVTEHSTQQEGKEEEPTVIFTGDIGFVGTLRKRKSGKRIIDFSVRTESDEGETENKQIRAFDGLAVFVSRNVRKNQSGVKVEAYPNKILPTWTQNKETGEWQKTERKGYIAKNVKTPKGSQGKKPKRSS